MGSPRSEISLSSTLKRTSKRSRMPKVYDTSKCHAKFRSPRIMRKRNRSFNEDRSLSFDHNRVIEARLDGVIFREGAAVGFRNIGVDNLNQVMDPKDWPKGEPLRSSESIKIDRDNDWEETWGKDASFHEKWGGSPSKGPNRPRKSKSRKDRSSRHSSPPSRSKITVKEVEGNRSSLFMPPSSKGGTGRPSDADRKKAILLNEHALSLMDNGRYKDAMSFFQKALGLDPSEETYQINMARCREWLEYQKRRGRS